MFIGTLFLQQPKGGSNPRVIRLKNFLNVVYLYSVLKTKEILTPDPTWMNPEDRMLSEINHSVRKGKYPYNDCTSRRSLEESNSWRQAVEGWVPGAGGGGLGVSVYKGESLHLGQECPGDGWGDDHATVKALNATELST